MKKSWLIYGANGYTGELIAREAARRGLRPILAGRSSERIEALARELDLPHRVFELTSPATIAGHLRDVSLVLHCAGPFAATAAPMMDACIQAAAHYLDITGEIDVFEQAQHRHAQAQAAGVVICPGVGMDVVPTDCVAAALHQVMPDATRLSLGFETGSGLSPGTAKTVVEGIGLGGKVRRDGAIVTVPQAWRSRRIDFGNGEKWAMTIPWGDVSTAWHTTGIPNIEVYTAVPRAAIPVARLGTLLGPLARNRLIGDTAKKILGKAIHGPDAAARSRHPTFIWGEVSNGAGQTRTARIRVANTYDLTIEGALAIAGELLARQHPPGSYTPAKLMGKDLVTRLAGSGSLTIS